jgi:hypothetical protein
MPNWRHEPARKPRWGGTSGSNPASSSEESATNRAAEIFESGSCRLCLIPRQRKSWREGVLGSALPGRPAMAGYGFLVGLASSLMGVSGGS